MQAIILAAGKGLRLRPHTETTPKTMLQVGGKPIIVHILEALPDTVDEIIVVVGHLKEQIIEHLGDSWNDLPITYVEQTPLNGTGAALYLAETRHALYLRKKFLVVNGDDLYNKADLTRLISHPLGILVSETKGPAPSSILVDKDGRMTGIELSPSTDQSILRNTGAYVLDQRFFEQPLAEITVHDKTEYSLPHTMVELSKIHPITIERAQFWLPIGTEDELNAARNKLKELDK